MKRGFAARRRNGVCFASYSPKANASRQRSCRFMFAEQTLHLIVGEGGRTMGRPYIIYLKLKRITIKFTQVHLPKRKRGE